MAAPIRLLVDCSYPPGHEARTKEVLLDSKEKAQLARDQKAGQKLREQEAVEASRPSRDELLAADVQAATTVEDLKAALLTFAQG